jgi:two-component system, NtrC family, sensor histidine kinase HydH
VDTLGAQSALVAVVVAFASSFALWLRPGGTATPRFGMLALCIAGYHVCLLLTATSTVMSARMVLAAAATMATQGFFDGILGDSSARTARLRRLVVLSSLACIVVSLTPLIDVGEVRIAMSIVLVWLLVARLVRVLLRASRVGSAAERTRLIYVGGGGLVAVFGVVIDVTAHRYAGFPVPAVGGLLVALYLYFLSQAISLSRLLDLHELLGKMLVFGSLAFVLAVVYGVLFLSVGTGRGFFLSNTLVASSLILILFEPLRLRLEEASARVFFREQLTFARGLRRLISRLQTTIELPQAISVFLNDIYDSKRVTHVSIFLLDAVRQGFVLHDHRGAEPVLHVDARNHQALFAHLLKQRSPLLRETLMRRVASATQPLTDDARQMPLAQEAALLRDLDATFADLVVPLRVQGNVAGFMALRDERLRDAFAADEIAALLAVADQLAINVENTRLFGLLRERDRLATLGEMSAGLAHEIRNPLAAIKGAAQELDPRALDTDEQELMQVIIDEVNRLNNVVSQFLDYARPFRGTFGPLSLNDVVKKTVSVMQHDLANITFDVELYDGLPDINGDPERLQQVLINFIINASDAMNRSGVLHLRTSLSSQGTIDLTVRDEGPGIAAAVLPQLFIPFFSTKERGNGLGLALCQRIIEHHGGRIDVRSMEAPAADHGATFVVRFPFPGAQGALRDRS